MVILVPVYLHFYVENKCCSVFNLAPVILLEMIGIPLLIIGLILFVSTIRSFAIKGKGTLAPWAPPKKLVVNGAYRYVRNPMISAVNFLLIGIAFTLQDENIWMWQLFFFGLNTVHFIFKEEPDLEKRFGEEYVTYKKNVSRWVPRIKGWVK